MTTDAEPNAADLIEIVAEQVCDDGAQIRKYAARVDDPVRLVDLFARVEGAKAAVSEALDAIKAAAIEAMDGQGLRSVRHPDHPKPLRVSRKASPMSTEWRNLLREVGSRTADECVDPETGERLPLGEICIRVIDAVLACAPLTASVKPTKSNQESMRLRGLDPGRYITKTKGDLTVGWEYRP